MQRYNPKEIEPKWQKIWAESKIYEADDNSSKPKKYILEYFPYPSGAAMHVGHVRNYTIGDVVARFNRMRGYNVLHPMGWDAFGLPAENYAIKTGISPRQAIDENTGRFKQQLMQMGFGHDWSREIDSTDPNYYRWTQWFFLFLLKKGLAYQQESLQWWCPHDKTVLANEQVEAGLCWRCGHEVEKKLLKQWFFKITDYADRLLDDLDDLDWSDAIKSMQRNWIGRSTGAQVEFKVDDSKETITVFTTRPDTLFGATFLVLAPEHDLVKQLTTDSQKTDVENYLKASRTKSDIERQETDREKTGVFTGAYAINPANNEKVPIWVADYVLVGYGTGAIMAVPAHDERDYEFALKFELPIVNVIDPVTGDELDAPTRRNSIVAIVRNPKTNEFLSVKWKLSKERHLFVGGGIEDNERPIDSAIREIREETGYQHIKHIATASFKAHHLYYSEAKDENRAIDATLLLFDLEDDAREAQKLEDYEQGRFDIVWLSQADTENLVQDELHKLAYQTLVLGEVFRGEGVMVGSGKYDGMPSSEAREKIVADLAKEKWGQEITNYKMRDWLISRQRYWGAPIPVIHCPKDGVVAVSEDQLPVILPEVKSFEPSGDGRSPLANVPEFVNVDCPACGGPAERETDTMDGFACSSWYFLRFADPHNDKAPFDKAKADLWLPVDDYIGGAEHAVMHLLYARFWTKVMFDDGLINFQEPFSTLRNQGMILAPDGAKMSKSKGNTIEPDGLIEQGYGADAIRIMELFIGPWNQSAAWSVEGLGGAFRFLQRAWTLVYEFTESSESESNKDDADKLMTLSHKTIKRVSGDLETLGFNTSIAALMEEVNELYKLKSEHGFKERNAWQQTLNVLVQLLAPIAPHISEELWVALGNQGSVHVSEWPVHDEKYLAESSMTIAVQVNGKVRAELSVASDASKEDIISAAMADEKVKGYLGNKEPAKTIYVPGKLVSFVVAA